MIAPAENQIKLHQICMKLKSMASEYTFDPSFYRYYYFWLA